MSRSRTLLIGLAALVLLPVLVRALGLGVNTATQIVTLAIAARMGDARERDPRPHEQGPAHHGQQSESEEGRAGNG